MKKLVSIILALVVSVMSYSVASEALAASNKVINLKFGHHIPSVVLQHKFFLEYADKVKEATNGRVNITVYGDGSLVRMEDCLSSIASGIADIGFVAFAYETSQLGLNNVMGSVSVNIPTSKDGRRIWDQLLNTFPEMREELKDYKFLMRAIGTSSNSLLTTKKMVHVPDDIKGMKIIATGQSAKLVKDAGASSLSLGSPDWYMSLERGLGDGIYAPMAVIDSRGCLELTPYVSHVFLGRGVYGVIMNKRKWDSLPDDVKAQIDGLSDWFSEEYPKCGVKTFTAADAKAQKLGHNIYYPTPAEMKSWRKLGDATTEEWIAKMESMKKPGRAVYEELRKLTQQYE